MVERTRFMLDEDKIPRAWYNISADLPVPQAPPLQLNLVTNGGFETTYFANNTHRINPSGSGWTFTVGATGAGSGIDRGDPYGSSGSWPIEGAQQAFLQSSGNLTTTRLARVMAEAVGFALQPRR